MSEENFNNPEEIQQEQHEELSKTDAISGIFTSPGETYETIANTPKRNYWLMAILICIALGYVSTFLFTRDNELTTRVMEKQKHKIREQMEQKAKEGSMTKEESEKAIEQSEKFTDTGGTFFKIIGYAGATAGPFLILFILSFIYLVILKIIKADFEFVNIMNVVGLAMVIGAIGNLIGTVLSVLKGDIVTAGLSLVMNEASLGEKVYDLITKLDLFSIWFYIVVGIGLSKIGKIETSKSIMISFIPYILYLAVTFIFSK